MEREIPHKTAENGIENSLFIVCERVQANPDNSPAINECVNIFIIQTEYTAKHKNLSEFLSAEAMVQ